MQNLLLLLARYGVVMLFIFLEILCFYLIVNYNHSQGEIYLNSSKLFSGYVLEKKEGIKSFVDLKDLNKQLEQENATLLQKVLNNNNSGDDGILQDSTTKYAIIPATIINNSVRFRNNNITLNKGLDHGLKLGMGVISLDGLIGVIRNVSSNYAQVISILNSQSRISAKINRSNYHGNLIWDGRSPIRMTLEAVPKHATIEVGDTISTSGFSSIFPENITIGTIEGFRVPRGNSNYVIDIKLNNDIAKVKNVYVIENLDLQEINKLEKEQDE